jgi:hypothetical protein
VLCGKVTRIFQLNAIRCRRHNRKCTERSPTKHRVDEQTSRSQVATGRGTGVLAPNLLTMRRPSLAKAAVSLELILDYLSHFKQTSHFTLWRW